MSSNVLSAPAITPGVFSGTASSDVAVSVRGLSKSYSIARNVEKHSTVAEALMHKLKNPLAKTERDTFWALSDVSFDIQKGDVVGIIGRNGAGKSTLLKILSRITEPTTGKIDLFGRVGSLLEVGTGFHQELTGRENIFLNGAILGMKKSEIVRQFDAIVDFSGTEKFLDTPVKRYSSGMYVRLAFAVAAHLNPEILIVDEVLAVGDAEFQKKCMGKMQDVASSGRTVLFVSHNMQSVTVLCNKGIFLERGTVTYQGDILPAIDLYLNSFAAASSQNTAPSSRRGSGEYRFTHVQPTKPMFDCTEEKVIQFRFKHTGGRVGQMYLSAHILDSKERIVAQLDSRLVGHFLSDCDEAEGVVKFTSPWLKPGTYRVDIGICSHNNVSDLYEGACVLEVSPVLPYSYSVADSATEHGLVLSNFEWESRSV